MTDVKCFWLEPTTRQREYLRRYSGSSVRKCAEPNSRYGYCNASAPAGESDFEPDTMVGRMVEKPPRDDPRWPKVCDACGTPFADDDNWQATGKTLYRRVDTGELMTIEDAPPGAMWNADWWPEKKPDGRYLAVKLPDGAEWHIDGAARSGGGWTRTGEPPNITARPSIRTSRYHGWLTDGVLRSC